MCLSTPFFKKLPLKENEKVAKCVYLVVVKTSKISSPVNANSIWSNHIFTLFLLDNAFFCKFTLAYFIDN